MGNKLDRYFFIVKEATTDFKLNNREALLFHCFNPDGLFEAYQVMRSEIRRLVNDGQLKSGWLIAHDCQYSINRLSELLDKKRVSSIKFRTWKSMFIDSIDAGYKALLERS